MSRILARTTLITLGLLAGAATVVARQADYTYVALYVLASYSYPEGKAAAIAAGTFKSPIPDHVKRLTGTRVMTEGFILPLVQDADKVTEFMLVGSYDNCGFGDVPTRINDWIMVRMRPGKFATYTDAMVMVRGTISVGEQFDDKKTLLNIYRMDGDAVSLSGTPYP